ncbi:C40 family peptidase [Actinomycetospora soli]|uniref:C40 family peptidase n=1 Tax=Actinomycetospora soli TaxID=2893887 RepID=UPI001E63042A|nr:NlpC/P60 family protein [Actinomycetospora soli]MCD2187845.1 NlpC/P60 family protein [Actinomycetospora soli]
MFTFVRRLLMLGIACGAAMSALLLVLVSTAIPALVGGPSEGGDAVVCTDAGGVEDVCRVSNAADRVPLAGAHGPLADCPQLRPGDRGPCVTALQRRLRALGVDIPITGRFEGLTTEAVRRVQREADPPIRDSGIVGLRTQLALEKAVAHRAGSSDGGVDSGLRIVAAARRIMAGQAPDWRSGPVPYVWGGGHGGRPGPTTGTCTGYEGPSPCKAETDLGLDCSGFTRYAVALATGRDVLGPGNTDDQRARSTAVGTPEPGDLVLFGSATDTHHVAIYLGDGRIVHAPDTGQNVQVGSLSDFDDVAGFYRVES